MDALLQTLIGGLLALAGAFIGPFLQRKHDRWLADREDQHLIREKAQELFDEIDRIVSQSAAASTSALARLKDDSVVAVQVPDLGRVRAICTIYFPLSMEIISEFEREHKELSQKMFQQMNNALKSDQKDVYTLKALPVLTTTAFQVMTTKFASDMRAHLHEAVPKLCKADLGTHQTQQPRIEV